MSPLDTVRGRLAELRTESADLLAQRGAILDVAVAAKRGMTEAEQTNYDDLATKRAAVEAQIPPVVEREAELEAQEAREAAAAQSRKVVGQTGPGAAGATVTDPPVYVRDGKNGQSYWRDLGKAQLFGDADAAARLHRHAAAMADEQRALGNTNTTGGSGGEFAPPAWLVEDYIKLARMGRVTADLMTHSDVPAGVSSVSLPKVLTGTSVGLQTSQNSALSQTDLTTGSVGTGFSTVGGKQIVSQQLLDQSAINFDQVITSDLAAAYAQQIGSQVLIGAGTGANNNSVVNGLTSAAIAGALDIAFTSASPTVALFYSKAAGAISGFVTNRLAQPTRWLMHPRRFYWLLAAVDSNNRPLVVPAPIAQNAFATSGIAAPVAGDTGMNFLGLPISIDPQLPTNVGAGTNQDDVYLVKQDDLWLFESSPVAETFRETYADSVGVLFRLYSYLGTILNRYPTSIARIRGTGLVAPTF